jgi:hypothetical protein
MSRSYTSSPPQASSWRVAGQLYFFTFGGVQMVKSLILRVSPATSFISLTFKLSPKRADVSGAQSNKSEQRKATEAAEGYKYSRND